MNVNIEKTDAPLYISKVSELNRGKDLKVYVVTFGCQQNEADSEKIRGLAQAMGYTVTDKSEEADLIILNTCAIREHAEVKALSMLGRLKGLKLKKPEMLIGLAGCMAGEEHNVVRIKRDFKYVDFTLEPNMLDRLPYLIYSALAEGERTFIHGLDRGDITEGMPHVRQSKHRAWVSIMYGCNNFCSYCIVPYVRGRERSRSMYDILAECRELINDGCREITLLGQNVNSYNAECDFADLVKAIAELDGDFKIKFMTSHPKDVSDKLIDVMSKTPKVAAHFHLPLQSGSDKILAAMNRTYNKKGFLSTVEKLRQTNPDISLSTDIIVGFPGESEEDFLDTLDVLSRVRFDTVYSFIYSPRNGTPAALMENQVDKDLKSERMSRLLELQDKISLDCALKYENKVVRILIDEAEEKDGICILKGRADNNKLVIIDGDKDAVGKYKFVKIERAQAFNMYGKIINDKEI